MTKQKKAVVPTIAVTLDYTDGNQRRHSLLPLDDDKDPLTDVEEIYPGDESSRKFSVVSSILDGGHTTSDTDTYSVDGSDMEEEDVDKLFDDRGLDSGCDGSCSSSGPHPLAVTWLEAKEGKTSKDSSWTGNGKGDFRNHTLFPFMSTDPAGHGHGGLTDVEDFDGDSPLPPEVYFETELEQHALLHAADPVQITSCKLNETYIEFSSDQEAEEIDFTDEEDVESLQRPPLEQQPTVVCKEPADLSDTDSEEVSDDGGSILDEEDLKGRRSPRDINKAMAHWTKLFNCMAVVEKWKRPSRDKILQNSSDTKQQEVDADGGPDAGGRHRLTSSWRSIVRQAVSQHRRQSRADLDLGAETEVDEVDDTDGEIVREIAETWLKKIRKQDELAVDILGEMDCGLDTSSKLAETEIVPNTLSPPEELETDQESVDACSAEESESEPMKRPTTLKIQDSTDEEEVEDPNAEIWHDIAANKAERQKLLNQARLMVLPSPTDGVINLVVPADGSSRRSSSDSACLGATARDDPVSETEFLSDAEDDGYFGYGWKLSDKTAGKRKLDHQQAMKCLKAIGTGSWNIKEGSTKMSDEKGESEFWTDFEEFETDIETDTEHGPDTDDVLTSTRPPEVVAISEKTNCLLVAANQETTKPPQMKFLSVDSRQNTELLTEEEDFAGGSDAEAYLRPWNASEEAARAVTPDVNFEHITIVEARDQECVVAHDKSQHTRHHRHQSSAAAAAANERQDGSDSSSDEDDHSARPRTSSGTGKNSREHGHKSKNSLQVADHRSMESKLTDTEEIFVNDEGETTASLSGRTQSLPERHEVPHHRGPRRRRQHK